MSGLDPRRVQQALVCMMLDPEWAAAVRGAGVIGELGERERELLRGVDPRALSADDLRRARAVHVIVDEYPVTAAVLGLDRVDRFFSSAEFRACVFGRGSMALAFGERWLGDAAFGVGTIEAALARARREEQRALAPGTIARAAGVAPRVVPAGTLAWYRDARDRLGAQPLAALLERGKPWAEQPPRDGEEPLLVEPQADGSSGIAAASRELVELLRAADPARPRAELRAVAIELGAAADEADALLDELVADGLLVARAGE